jgi:maltooligosyltrehalose trehalohydrolase
VLHVLLTNEQEGYYEDYAHDRAAKLARSLAEGFIYQGEPSKHRNGEQRGTPSADLPPTAFVLFLQNHDQIGNRAFGERLTALAEPAALEAAISLQILAPQIPLIFMGEEEASRAPFYFFCDYQGDLADTVREGRRREFANFAAFADPARRELVPDPNASSTFEASFPRPDPELSSSRRDLYRRLLAVRSSEIVPRLVGARSLTAAAVSRAAVLASWQMGDGSVLTIACNLGADDAWTAAPAGRCLFESRPGAVEKARVGILPARTTSAFLEVAP